MANSAFPESLLAYALATISEGSLIADAQHRTLYANAAFTVITGYTEADMLDQNCRILQGPGTSPEAVGKMRQALAAGTTYRGTLLNYRKDGSPFWNDITIAPLHDSHGEVTHFVSVQRDISPQIDLQNQLRAQAAARPSWWQFGFTRGSPPAQSTTPSSQNAPSTPDAYRQLLLADGLLMYVQPVVQLQTGAVHHIEALARLRMPDHAIVPPDVFLPFFGQPELNELFRKGLHQALGWLATWDQSGLKLRISINLPPTTLHDRACPEWIAQTLKHHGIEPYRLSLELLETEPFHNTEQQAAALRKITALGVELTMDDLGSGYSSLSRFTALDFNAVKIDRGLTNHMHTKPQQTLSLLRSLIAICRDFKRRVVAEGLEDNGMVEALAVLGAEYGQGNAIAKPMPAEDLAAWIKAFTFRNPPSPTTPLGILALELIIKK